MLDCFLVHVLDFYFLDMIMWLHVSSMNFNNLGVGGRERRWVRYGRPYNRRRPTEPTASASPSLLRIQAFLLGYSFLSLSTDHTDRFLIS
jgi:hypothetical protein